MSVPNQMMTKFTEENHCFALQKRVQSMVDEDSRSISLFIQNPSSACKIRLRIPVAFTVKQVIDLLISADQKQVMISHDSARHLIVLFCVRKSRLLDSNLSLAAADIQDNDIVELRWRSVAKSHETSRPARIDRTRGYKVNSSVIAIGMTIVIAVTFGIAVGLLISQWSPVSQKSALVPTLTLVEEIDTTYSDSHSLTPAIPTNTSVPLPLMSPSPAPMPTATPLFFSEGPFLIGHSAGSRSLYAYRLGTGPSVRAIIGGIHGGYEPNTAVFVSQTLEYLQAHSELVPVSVTLYIVPLANPDGFVTGRGTLDGRMNANNVDLNRNWDYQWQMTATHGYRPVSAGAYPFSEPETAALRDLILSRDVEAAIVYHSGLAKIFSAADTTNSATIELAEMMSEVTGYPYAPEGVPGQITTGDAIDWMSTKGIAAVEVELTDHKDPEWARNIEGVIAFLNWRFDAPTSALTSPIDDIELGLSVEGRVIRGTRIGDGKKTAIVVIGAIHGDEKNTYALVRDLGEHYHAHPDLVPDSHVLYFIPTMNPDGLAADTKYNANRVDLNQNWDTDDWVRDVAGASGIEPGAGGSSPASEPEVQNVAWQLLIIQEKVEEVTVLFYYSPYSPTGFVLPGYSKYGVPGDVSEPLARLAAEVSGYRYGVNRDSATPFTGEAIHWCNNNGIASIYIELPDQSEPSDIPAGFTERSLDTHLQVLEALIQHTSDTSQ